MTKPIMNAFVKTQTLAALIVLAIVACTPPAKEETKPTLSEKELIKRGLYLTTVGACNDCHSPKVMTPYGPDTDTTRKLSGHPENEKLPMVGNSENWILFSMGLTGFVGPWGTSYAANLTPDETGIGNWTFEQFKTALRKGKYKGLEGGRDLLPPMPWIMYRNFTDEDILAVFTYLKSLPPIKNVVPAPVAPNAMNKVLVSQK
jgi:hypothetical protein